MFNYDIIRAIIDKCDVRDLYTLAQTNVFICENIIFVMNSFLSVLKHKIHIIKTNESINNKLRRTSKYNYRNSTDYLIEKDVDTDNSIWNLAICIAAFYNHSDLIDFFIEKCTDTNNNVWNLVTYCATLGGHKDLATLSFEKNIANDSILDYEMYDAVYGKNADLCLFFIKKCSRANNYIWNSAMYYAIRDGHKDLVDFFIEKGKTMSSRTF